MNPQLLIDIVSPVSSEPDAYQAWAEQTKLSDLFSSQRESSSELLLYGSAVGKGSGSSILIHSILMPSADIAATKPENLIEWDTSPWDSWSCGLVYGAGGTRVEYDKPLSRNQNVYAGGQQLVFGRTFEGRLEDKQYFEIAQSLTHAHDLHWTPERKAWCRFNDDGDIEDVIVQEEIDAGGLYGTAVAISIKREVLEMHMSATDTVLVQMFDSTCVPSKFHGWGKGDNPTKVDEELGLFYRGHVEETQGSYFRGTHIIRPQLSSAEFGEKLLNAQKAVKQYESFITRDVKNSKTHLVSCDPENLASYFEPDSPLPLQISPVFFSAQVLDKYKADPDKYSLANRSITCRNSWHLKTYDVNESGQVHTYIRYLGFLPFSEQQYWKSFNEAPKGSISKRAFTTDIVGTPYEGIDSLDDLKGVLHSLDGTTSWFTVRERDLIEQLHYPHTASSKIWGDTLTTLAKCVCECLNQRHFELAAKERGIQGEATWRSIKWAEMALVSLDVEHDVLQSIIDPLRETQRLRTKLNAHSAGSEAAAIRAQLLRQYKSPKGHIENLSGQLASSLRQLKELFG